MGLAISVGVLADVLENDPEFAEEIRAELDEMNKALRAKELRRRPAR